MSGLNPKICGQSPIALPGCDQFSCESLIADAKVELRDELNASQAAQNATLRGEISSTASTLRGELASSQAAQNTQIAADIESAKSTLRSELSASQTAQNTTLRGEIEASAESVLGEIASTASTLRGELNDSQAAQNATLRGELASSQDAQNVTLRAEIAAAKQEAIDTAVQTATSTPNNYDTDYNKPQINNVTLQGNVSLQDLGIYQLTPEEAAEVTQIREMLDEAIEVIDQATSLDRQQYTQTFVTTGTTSTVSFMPSGYVYNDSDVYSVYVNGLRLSDSEYTRNDSIITFTTPISGSGNVIQVVVDTYTGILDNAVRVDENGLFYVEMEEE